MKKIASIAAAVVVAPVLFASAPVFADSPGQLSNAATNYEVKNVTKGGAYGQTITATCGDNVKYSVLIANSDFGQLKDLTVKANLGSGAINVSAKNVNNDTTTVNGTAKVNVAKGMLTYKNGSTVRINSDGSGRTTLANGVTTANGVNAGELKGSTQTFVQFEADVKCDDTPPVTPPTTTTPPTKNEKPVELVKTGPAQAAAIFAAVAAFSALAYNVVLRRQNAR